ncbi:MAG: sigma-70 family RNA polymerase sigma factor [Pseudomonadota bacterium]
MRQRSAHPAGIGPASGDGRSPASLSDLYRAHWHDLRRFVAARFGAGPPEPDEVAQRAFERLAMREDLADIQEPMAFLRVTATNIVLSEKRSHSVRDRNQAAVAQRYGATEGDDLTPERVLLAREQIAIVHGAFTAMPTRRRRVIILHKIYGLSFAEIARRLGLSQTAVKKHAARAMADLDAALADAE